MFDSRAGIFFLDPKIPLANFPATYGVLYLLRRDIHRCLEENTPPISYPGMMAILAGIDLLAKFYLGDDSPGKVGKRFRTFLRQFFSLESPADEEIIYQFRNSLLHSFGLSSRISATKAYHFHLEEVRHTFLRRLPMSDIYFIGVFALKDQFDQAIERYRSALDNDKTLQDNFLRMYSLYGSIRIIV